jgi:hypothetical protein
MPLPMRSHILSSTGKVNLQSMEMYLSSCMSSYTIKLIAQSIVESNRTSETIVKGGDDRDPLQSQISLEDT